MDVQVQLNVARESTTNLTPQLTATLTSPLEYEIDCRSSVAGAGIIK